MQALNQVARTVLAQLRGLSPSSRLLIGSLMVILVMALFIVALYSGQRRLVPLPVKLDGEARTAAIDYLETRSLPWRDRGDQILVPAEQRHLLLAQLTEQEIIRPDQIDFDALVQQDSPFLSKAQHDRRWLVATMNHLSRTITRMAGIARADVVIDEPKRRAGLGRASVRPSASVNVLMEGGALTQEQVNAIAGMVAGAHAELRPADVAVIDANAGRVHQASDAEHQRATRYLELQESTTEMYEQKLSKALQYIRGVNIAVNVIVDHREVVEQTRRFDDPKQGVTRESSRAMASDNRRPVGEPGVLLNTGASLAAVTQRTSSLTDEQSDTNLVPAFGGTDSRTLDPGGYALKINAAIGVPRSYFLRLWRDETAQQDADPTAEELAEVVDRELLRIRGHVQPLVDTGPRGGLVDGDLAVSMIPDYDISEPGEEAAGAAWDSMTAGAGSRDGLIKYASLGALALVSLAMMFMMVRKANARQALPGAEELAGVPGPLSAADADLAGEAAEALPALEALEVDEQTLRHRQILQQVNDLADSRPVEAADVLRQWMRSEG